MMRAAVVSRFDAPPAYGSFDDPVAGEGEQLVRVRAAGLHQLVRGRASGRHYSAKGSLPFVPGVDGVGTLPSGERVYFVTLNPPFGTMAEYSLAKEDFMLPLPGALDDVTAAGMANPAMSSSVALTVRAPLHKRENVLILGATGTSGLLAVQIAQRLGAGRVVAVGRNAEQLAQAAKLGAEVTISLEQDEAAIVDAFAEQIGRGVDVVLDYVWGRPAELLLEATGRRKGDAAARLLRYVQIGNMAGAEIKLGGPTLRSTNLQLLGSGLGSASEAEILSSLKWFFAEAAREAFDFQAEAAPLAEVEARWNDPQTEGRLVFQP